MCGLVAVCNEEAFCAAALISPSDFSRLSLVPFSPILLSPSPATARPAAAAPDPGGDGGNPHDRGGASGGIGGGGVGRGHVPLSSGQEHAAAASRTAALIAAPCASVAPGNIHLHGTIVRSLGISPGAVLALAHPPPDLRPEPDSRAAVVLAPLDRGVPRVEPSTIGTSLAGVWLARGSIVPLLTAHNTVHCYAVSGVASPGAIATAQTRYVVRDRPILDGDDDGSDNKNSFSHGESNNGFTEDSGKGVKTLRGEARLDVGALEHGIVSALGGGCDLDLVKGLCVAVADALTGAGGDDGRASDDVGDMMQALSIGGDGGEGGGVQMEGGGGLEADIAALSIEPLAQTGGRQGLRARGGPHGGYAHGCPGEGAKQCEGVKECEDMLLGPRRGERTPTPTPTPTRTPTPTPTRTASIAVIFEASFSTVPDSLNPKP